MTIARPLFALMTGLMLTAWTDLACSAERAVSFRPGATSVTLKGMIRGGGDATFSLQTGEGQVMRTLLTTPNRSCNINVFEPGQQEAAHIGSVSGNAFGRNPTKAGAYRFQIALMRNAARRNEACRYSLSIELTGKAGGVSPGVSDREMRDRCRAKVAEMYASRTALVSLSSIRRDTNGPFINGSVNKGTEGVKRFRCLYSPERHLRDVMALTPDGE